MVLAMELRTLGFQSLHPNSKLLSIEDRAVWHSHGFEFWVFGFKLQGFFWHLKRKIVHS